LNLLSEKRDVQIALIDYLIGIGWEYITPSKALEWRDGSLREPFLLPIAREKLVELNKPVVTAASVGDVLKKIKGVQPSISGNEEFLNYLRGQRTVYFEKERRERNLTLIDYEKPQKNQFTCTQEFRFQDRDERRADILLFVNGFPVGIIENKSPTLEDAEIEAFDQVQLYTERIPELLKFNQFFVACNGFSLHYGATWNDDIKAFYRWKSKNGKDYGLENLAKSFLAHEQVLQLLRDYVIFFRIDDQTKKFILRPHQMRAVEKVVNRVEVEKKDSGLIWHTQGSGKTLTMIVAAHQLRRVESLENPTILVVVDRIELENQMFQNFESFRFPNVVTARSKEHLRELLASDYRGLIITLIHKFNRIDADLNQRENIIVLIDEAHRSQEGELGTYMRSALLKASYFGFTGTPVDRGKIGRGTFETFGKFDPEGYLDKYSIDESIEDKTTVPLYYTLTPSELRLNRDILENEFFKVVEDAGVASIEELNKILGKLEKLKAVLKSDDRVDKIAAHIAEHYRDYVEPLGFKAFIVAVDREACALYKQAIDKYLPEDYSKVVYTRNHKDRDLLREYHISDDEEKRTRKAFKSSSEMPKILIVTEKLLTGYDAPVLYCMYLDKPLKDHTLLQAIARVNRPYPEKTSGLIVDYIGVFENLQRALAFDAQTVTKGLIDLEVLKGRFGKLMAQAKEMIEPINLEDAGRVERIIDYFFDVERREAYLKLFREIEEAYEILSPDAFLRPYLEDYKLLIQIQKVIYNFFNPEAERKRIQRDILKKTEKLIRATVQLDSIVDSLPIYEINKDIANLIKSDELPLRVKLANLHRSLIFYIETHKETQPYLISIAEKIEQIIAELKERQKSVESALEELTRLSENISVAGEEQEQLRLSREEFTIFWVLREHGVDNPKERCKGVNQILEAHQDWFVNEQIERTLRMKLYGLLRQGEVALEVKTMVEIANGLLRMHRRMAA